MELKEKVAYIKGLMEGMKFDTETNEGKLLTAIVGVLGDMAAEVTDMDEDVNELYNAVDALSAVSYTHLDVYKRQVEDQQRGTEGLPVRQL